MPAGRRRYIEVMRALAFAMLPACGARSGLLEPEVDAAVCPPSTSLPFGACAVRGMQCPATQVCFMTPTPTTCTCAADAADALVWQCSPLRVCTGPLEPPDLAA